MSRALLILLVIVPPALAAVDEIALRRLQDRNQPLNQLIIAIERKSPIEAQVLDAMAAQAFSDETLQGPTTTDNYAERRALLEKMIWEERLAQLAGTTMDDVRSAIQDAKESPDGPSIAMVDIALAGISYIKSGGTAPGPGPAQPVAAPPASGSSTMNWGLVLAVVIILTFGVASGTYFIGLKMGRDGKTPSVQVNPGAAAMANQAPQPTTIQRSRPEAPVAVPRAQQPTMPIMVDALLDHARPSRPMPPPPPSGSTPAVKPFGNLETDGRGERQIKYSGNLKPKSNSPEDDTPTRPSGSAGGLFSEETGDETDQRKGKAPDRSGDTRRHVDPAKAKPVPPPAPAPPLAELSLNLSEMLPRGLAPAPPPVKEPAPARISTSAGGIQKMSISSFMPIVPEAPAADANSEDIFPARYKDRTVLGRGGMGVVYRAVDSKCADPAQAVVAIKTLTPQALESATARDRFHRECAAMLALDHPGIIKVHTVGQMPGRAPYIVMEFVKAQDIASKLLEGTISPELTLKIGIQLAQALGYAHSQGVLHRDLKPGNMLLTDDEVVKVVDFGLAKLEDSANITQAGTVLGSLRFMAPEQLLGESVDRRADIYGVGSTLYYMVAGVTPYEGQPPPNKLTKDAVPILSVMPGLNRDLAAAIMKCLGRSMKDRYQTMGELEEDLVKIKL